MSRIVCDADKCIGCLACVVTCMDHHYSAEEDNAQSRRVYFKLENEAGFTQYITDSCHNCQDAPCMEFCPTNAIFRKADGWTGVDASRCISCGMCFDACPYHIPKFDKKGTALRCDGCSACVDICPTGALKVE